jgi:hypothetical protein
MGLDGENSKPTATVANPELVKLIREVAAPLGAYPHVAIDGDFGNKQSTRLLKVQCTDCGYINEAGNGYTARITMTWIENAGLPVCPCGATMDLVDKSVDTEFVALLPVESSATYKVPSADGEGHDDRFQVRRTSSEHGGDRWTVIDMGERFTTIAGVLVPNMEAQARIVAAESKENALEMIHAIREGLSTWDELDDDQDDLWDDEDDDGSNPLADDDPDLDRLLYIGDDEDETPENPEDAEPETAWTRVHPVTQKEFVHSFDYELITEQREASGTRKSAQIAAGEEGALD